MGGREIDWEDEDIVSGFKKDKYRQFRAKPGVTHVARVMTMPVQYRVHKINDVLEPDKDGEENCFNMNCSKTWDDAADGDDDEQGTGGWVGDCEGCEKEYDLQDRYVAGLAVVGEIRKGSVKKVSAAESPHYWDFGNDKYRSLSDIRLSMKRGKKNRPLKAVELEIKLNDSKPEVFQDLNIQKRDSDHDVLTTKNHVAEWKEQGPELVKDSQEGPSKAEWKRRLKSKKSTKRRRPDPKDEPDDDPKKKRGARKASGKRGKQEEPDDEPESTGDEELDDLLGELE